MHEVRRPRPRGPQQAEEEMRRVAGDMPDWDAPSEQVCRVADLEMRLSDARRNLKLCEAHEREARLNTTIGREVVKRLAEQYEEAVSATVALRAARLAAVER